ncbi:DEKNAAC102540 [Brettanomyces naardenensis]|uniref:Protein phosphatase methylesterase 1 n=1 Tax=Brettanomyces naardenensis TaxID=13370 RepID=A0A448YKM1_BRENA|nr:DEKNAAC102540 [Brettanomyces naardenensis]
MSDFQRKLFQNRLAKAEQQLGVNISDVSGEDGGGTNESEDSFGDIAPLPTFRNRNAHSNLKRSSGSDDDAKYLRSLPKWSAFFDSNDIYRDPKTGYCFQTYYSNPVLGETLSDTPNNPVIFIAHHGAGSSGLTFAKLTESITKQARVQGYDSTPGLFTFDMRGHANTMMLNKRGRDGLNFDLSIDQICKDFVFVLGQFFNAHFKEGEQAPSLFLIGHSLGGSVITKIIYEQQHAEDNQKPLPKVISDCIKGLIMVDIVEDTAVKALNSMSSYLRGVPQQFPSMEKAVDWHLRSGLLNNRNSALISVPPLMYKSSPGGFYHWVTDLRRTSPYWSTWFTGLSSNFISITNSVSKMLILVNNDYLDKDLMIGQMQGRYQLLVFHNSQLQLKNTLTTLTQTVCSEDSDQLGHFVHEDIPDKVAISLLEFVERNDYRALSRPENAATNSKIDLLNKLNAKWGVGKK